MRTIQEILVAEKPRIIVIAERNIGAKMFSAVIH